MRTIIRYNKLIFTIVFILSTLLLGGCALIPPGQSSEPGVTNLSTDYRLQAVLEVPPELSSGEIVEVHFTMTNNSATEKYVLTWYTPFEGIAGEIFVVERDGQAVPYQGILASRTTPTREEYVLLEPGGSAAAKVDLATAYDFSISGEYTIEFISPRISHVAGTVSELATSLDDLGPVQITSNTVKVRIVGLSDPSG